MNHRASSSDTSATIQVQLPERSRDFLRVKRCIQGCFGVLVMRRLMCYRVAHRLLGSRAFSAASESIARVPGLRGVYLRQAFYRHTLRYCGRDVYLGWQSVFSMTEAVVGERAYIGRFCSIGYAIIGPDVMLADGVHILSGGREHGRDDPETPMHDQLQTYRPVTIGQGVWLGAGATIMADVGERSVIGAGAVVTKPIPDNCVAVGVPARVVKQDDVPSLTREN